MNFRHYRATIVCALLMIGAAGFAIGQSAVPAGKPAGIEINLTCKNSSSAGLIRPQEGARLVWQTKAPEGTWILPDLNGRQVLYTMIRIGETQRLAVMDRSPESDATIDSVMTGFGDSVSANAAFFNRVYFDANGNGNLRDDPVIVGQVDDSRLGQFVTFMPVEAKVSDKDPSLLSRFFLQVSVQIKPTPEMDVATLQKNLLCRCLTQCVLAGEFELEGQKMLVELGDGNGNGYFYDQLLDSISLCRVSQPGNPGTAQCSDVLVIDGKTFQAKMDVLGRKLVLLNPAGSLCAVKLSSDAEVVQLLSDKKQTGIAMFNPGRQVLVPVGRYVLGNYTVGKNDKEGNRWVISGAGNAGVTVDALADTTGELMFGEPLMSTAILSGDTEKLRFSVKTTGCAKEAISSVARLAASQVGLAPSKQSPERIAPAFKILNTKADVVGRGKFEFG